MNRFFGMMPSSEIEIEKRYTDSNGLCISIQAGTHGWTIIYADMSSEFDDVDAESVKNFATAYTIATTRLGILHEKCS